MKVAPFPLERAAVERGVVTPAPAATGTAEREGSSPLPPSRRPNLVAISYGGGVQSTALVVLAAAGEIECDLAIFANVGDRAEKPETIEYVREIQPWAGCSGVEVVEARWVDRTGKVRDLYDDVVDPTKADIPIPVWMDGGGPGRRKCTGRYKIEVVGRELRRRGATPENPATVMVGISTDEWQRINRRTAQDWETPSYPLLDLGLSRHDCERIISDAGLPVPPKSACWFCPMQGPKGWAHKRRHEPDVFAAGVELENRINAKRESMGRDAVSLAAGGVPLAGVRESDPTLFEGQCDEGYCWT